MPKILVTNDDGVNSAGIVELAEALKSVGEVFVVAPAHEMSAASHSLTLTRPLRIDKIGDHRFAVDGTPTDCVTLALKKVFTEGLPNLVVSGINRGANLGDDTTYSGTVAGALEGTIFGIPAIAISLMSTADRTYDFKYAAEFAVFAAKKVLEEGLPHGTLLNINVPIGPIMGAMVTRQGRKSVATKIIEGLDPRNRPYYWIGEDESTWNVEDGTDYEAINKGLVSITPLRNDLTDYRALEEIAHWHGVMHH
ncbi:MAG TPA: 5'/3'-nucleotidase SurE [Blastocatellia bacterium]|nr:5'/3'-nucleotidase SurE [Blastocatellia bacterium]